MRYLQFLGFLFILSNSFTQQQYTGYSNDNNSGFTGVYAQPAALVDDKAKLNITSSFAYFKTNNYSATNLNFFFNPLTNQRNKYREPKKHGYMSSNYSIDIIGIKYEINHGNAVGYSLRYRSFTNLDELPKELAKFDFNAYYDSSFANPYSVQLTKFGFSKMNYLEHSFNYARVIKNEGEHFLKAGVALKIINGIDASYYYMKGDLNFENAATTSFSNTSVQYGQAGNSNSLSGRNNGFGIDLGAVYEYRPNYDSYKYEMDGLRNIERYDKKKYKYKVGVSITNIGRVKFNKALNMNDLTTSNYVGMQAILGPQALPNTYFQNVLEPFSTVNSTQISTFKMSLPASLNLQFDYLIKNGFYLNYSSSLSVKNPNDANKVHEKMIHTFTPRIEKDNYSILLPISIQRNAQFNVGIVGRVARKGKNFFIGSNNLSFLVFGKRAIYNTSFYIGTSFNILYKVPSDIDGDKISDAKDDCRYDPGLAQFKGCPDTDGDGIPDKDDYCIYDKGPKSTFGCPDRDNDGVIDLNDQCPDDAGLAIHYGCPDRDMDGVIDVADQCPDVPGVELNNGCPFEKTNCCNDDDGDGISNEVDKCPSVQGSVYNYGCPIDSSSINTIDFKRVKDSLDPNHTIAKVDLIDKENTESIEIHMDSGDLSIRENQKHLDILDVYFRTDDATLNDSTQKEISKLIKKNQNKKFVIVGHTDNRGTDNYNLILSKKRSEIVKRTLINKGIEGDNIEVYYFGEWKPIKSNDNVIERKFNRRVEIRVY